MTLIVKHKHTDAEQITQIFVLTVIFLVYVHFPPMTGFARNPLMHGKSNT